MSLITPIPCSLGNGPPQKGLAEPRGGRGEERRGGDTPPKKNPQRWREALPGTSTRVGQGRQGCAGVLGMGPPRSQFPDASFPLCRDKGGLCSDPAPPDPLQPPRWALPGVPGHPRPSLRWHPVPGQRIPASAAAAFPWRWHLPSPHRRSGSVSMEMPYPARHNLSERFPPRCCSGTSHPQRCGARGGTGCPPLVTGAWSSRQPRCYPPGVCRAATPHSGSPGGGGSLPGEGKSLYPPMSLSLLPPCSSHSDVEGTSGPGRDVRATRDSGGAGGCPEQRYPKPQDTKPPPECGGGVTLAPVRGSKHQPSSSFRELSTVLGPKTRGNWGIEPQTSSLRAGGCLAGLWQSHSPKNLWREEAGIKDPKPAGLRQSRG